MPDNIFQGIFANSGESVISVGDFLLCIGCSLIIGIILALSYMYRTRYTKSFVITLALLPAAVCAVIMMVNGNIGAGVAVAGAFSLVRFRSAAGNAQEILAVFLAMAVGLATGMGYIGIAAFFTVVVSVILLVFGKILSKKEEGERILKITVPEHLEFDGVFEDVLSKYTDEHSLQDVKTTNMGSLYKLTYTIRLKKDTAIKEFIDSLREQNGNLEISCGYPVTKNIEL